MNYLQRTALVVVAAHLALACGTTEGRIVRVALALEPEADMDRPLGEFETATGWEVRLERAEVTIAALYAFGPEEEPDVVARLGDLLVPVAHAHGGQDALSGKRVRAELVEPFVFDALAEGRMHLEELDAEAGPVASLAIDIAQPDGPGTESLDGQQAYVEGEATRGDETVHFAGGLTVPDAAVTRRIEVAVDGAALDEQTTVVVAVRPHVWLRDADFDRLLDGDQAPSSADDPQPIAAESQVGRAWFIGVRSPAAYHVRTFEEEE